MKYIYYFLLGIWFMMMILGILLINVSWITFLILLFANIVFSKSYPILEWHELSVLGTPIEMFFGGLLIFIISLLVRSMLASIITHNTRRN